MRYLKVLKNSIQNVLDQFCPSLSQRWKMMQMFMGSWLLLTNDSQFYFYCQKFKWSPPRNSHRTLYWNVGLLGSIEISIAQASITQVWQIFSPILPWKQWTNKPHQYPAEVDPLIFYSAQFINMLLFLTVINNYKKIPHNLKKHKCIQKGAKQLSDKLYTGLVKLKTTGPKWAHLC